MFHKRIYTGFIAASALALAMPIAAFAWSKASERHPTEHVQSRVERSAAEKAALAEVPNGTIRNEHLEHHRGKAVWAFDVAAPQSNRTTRVLIEADNGHILSSGAKTHHRMRQAKAETH